MTTLTVPEPISKVRNFLNEPHKLLIGGNWVTSAGGETFEVLDPSNNSLLAKVAKGGEEDINRAVKAARQAFENGPWRKLTSSERGRTIWTD